MGKIVVHWRYADVLKIMMSKSNKNVIIKWPLVRGIDFLGKSEFRLLNNNDAFDICVIDL